MKSSRLSMSSNDRNICLKTKIIQSIFQLEFQFSKIFLTLHAVEGTFDLNRESGVSKQRQHHLVSSFVKPACYNIQAVNAISI